MSHNLPIHSSSYHYQYPISPLSFMNSNQVEATIQNKIQALPKEPHILYLQEQFIKMILVFVCFGLVGQATHQAKVPVINDLGNPWQCYVTTYVTYRPDWHYVISYCEKEIFSV